MVRAHCPSLREAVCKVGQNANRTQNTVRVRSFLADLAYCKASVTKGNRDLLAHRFLALGVGFICLPRVI